MGEGGRGGSVQVPVYIPAFPDIAADYIHARLGVFGRRQGCFGPLLDCIFTLKRGARGAVRGYVQSKVRRLRQKVCTFHDIENTHVMKWRQGAGMETGQAHGARGTRDGGEDEHGLSPGFQVKVGK
jgi:hypothetical protein